MPTGEASIIRYITANFDRVQVSPATFDGVVQPLLTEAYDLAVGKLSKRAARR